MFGKRAKADPPSPDAADPIATATAAAFDDEPGPAELGPTNAEPGPTNASRPAAPPDPSPWPPSLETEESDVATRGPVGRRWKVGDPGRAFGEVRPILLGKRDTPPDTVIDGGSLGTLEIRAASVCGLAHRDSGKPRQDAYGFCLDRSGKLLIVAVADGVSAGPYSHHAADIVARQGLVEIGRRLAAGPLETLIWYEVFQSLASTIVAAGKHRLRGTNGAEPSDKEAAQVMSATATFVVYHLDLDAGQRAVTVAWVGDSPIWTVGSGGWKNLSTTKATGADGLNSSAVAALPYLPPTPERLAVRSLLIGRDDVLLVMTDGVGDPLGDATGEVAKELAKWWRDPPEPMEFAEQVAFGRRSYDDDRTVVAVWPSAARRT